MAKYNKFNRRISSLISALIDAGISQAKTTAGARQTLQDWIERGVLTLRKMPHSGHYALSDKEIEAIVKAFSPEGEGYFHWEEFEGGEDK